MTIHLNDFQRGYAQHRIAFAADVLSLELAESLRRTSLACAENQKKQVGIIDVLCGLYLQDREEIAQLFRGDLPAVVTQNFPIHGFGREGLFPKVMLDQMASEEGGESSFGFSLNYSDDVFRLLWLSEKLANAVGKNASIKDVVAALGLDRAWMDELLRSGLAPSRSLADFDKEVRTIIFHAAPHTGEEWRRDFDFQLDEGIRPPYRLEVSTPSGPFQPVRFARVRLNGNEVADVSWPEKPNGSANVELRASNKIEIELDGPRFGSMELNVRGIPA
jgi:hypothetical protein